MACGGCAARRDMLRQAVEQARQRNMRGAAQKVGQAATSFKKDMARVLKSPLAGKRGR